MKHDMRSCGGCRTCEMACSFHHTGEYTPSVSSIKILEKESGGGYFVLIVEKNDPAGLACDLCAGLARPLCIQVCREENDLADILKKLVPQNNGEKESGGSC